MYNCKPDNVAYYTQYMHCIYVFTVYTVYAVYAVYTGHNLYYKLYTVVYCTHVRRTTSSHAPSIMWNASQTRLHIIHSIHTCIFSEDTVCKLQSACRWCASHQCGSAQCTVHVVAHIAHIQGDPEKTLFSNLCSTWGSRMIHRVEYQSKTFPNIVFLIEHSILTWNCVTVVFVDSLGLGVMAFNSPSPLPLRIQNSV